MLKRFFIKLFILITILIVITFAYYSYSTKHIINVHEFKIQSNKIPKSHSGIKIVQFADTLFTNNIEEDKISNLVESINILKPDIVVFTGNLTYKVNKLNESNVKLINKYFDQIYHTIGLYYVKGNEDYNNLNFDDIMQNIDAINVTSECASIYNGLSNMIKLCGYNYEKEETTNDENIFTIYASSSSKQVKKLLKTDAEVILNTNSLTNSLVLPYIDPINFDNDESLYESFYEEKNNKYIYTTNGIGYKNVSIRLFNTPSINLFRLKSL